ncbi:Glycosyl hydrolase family 92 [Posidoniimonas corsicana]|uniref:Glycosyl hydrolase family 92 n=1 Tax=Posidoniimonas corsicana TaxID=1938618 RepID=A0A5C5VCD1_9BACT|nr:GH92 family glycosyl hydrolase [Posidoniimonas corsicana]TWT35382.1 Glycosyl hydrolase family 92 [Posidoniimonas corsicana]
MKSLQLALTLLSVGSCCWGRGANADDLTHLVNPQIDTHKSRWFYFSSACRPFGMVNLSPDTSTKGSWNSGYLYDDEFVRCFSHIHAWQMSGIPVMPTTGEFRGHLGMDEYKSRYSHDSEIVHPGYHKLTLERYGIDAELTSTCRTGWHRYTFPAGEAGYVLFDTGAFLAHGGVVASSVSRVGPTEIAGWSLMERTSRRPKDTRVFFVARFSRPFEEFLSWVGGELTLGAAGVEGAEAGSAVRFAASADRQVIVKIGISYTSIEGARRNLDAEASHWDFDRVRRESTQEWNEWLSRIRVTGGHPEHRIKLYTDLWHALLGRRIVSDADGSYCDMTRTRPRIQRKRLNAQGEPVYAHYAFDALWGSHWSLNILWTLAYPDVADGFCNTMVDMYRDGGLIPRGPSGGNYTYVMIGDPAAPFFAAAHNKGIRGYDVDAAYEGLRKNAFPGGIRDRAGYEHQANAGGGGIKHYVDLGYVPEDMGGGGAHRDGAAMTLEYAYQDWCLAQLARSLGKDSDYNLFMKRSQNYRSLWDGEARLVRPRMKDGSWMPGFTPTGKGMSCRGFCESNSMIYSHFVPHDMKGLIGIAGGAEAYATRLNESFEQSASSRFVADHGRHAEKLVDYDNQPGTAMAHLFNYAGKPWLSQKWVREVKLKAHGDTTPYGGYHGDEDQGQMGALGVLMAIGLFQVDGGAGSDSVYEITAPLFDEVRVQLHGAYFPGGEFRIVARNQSLENCYIQSAALNGRELNRCWLSHSEVAAGGTLELVLGASPNRSWGLEPPPSR